MLFTIHVKRRNLASGNIDIIRSYDAKHFDILNYLGVARQCDTYRMVFSNRLLHKDDTNNDGCGLWSPDVGPRFGSPFLRISHNCQLKCIKFVFI